MRRRRFLTILCSAILAIITVNELANFLGRKLEFSNSGIQEPGQPYLIQNRIPKHGEVLKSRVTSINNITKSADSVIPDMFYERLQNNTAHDFRYILNPTQYCSEIKHSSEEYVKLLVLIASAPWEFDRRDIIRRTWAAETDGMVVGFLFFFGYDGNMKTYVSLKKEFQKYRDIVMEDYVESYRNLSLKTQSQLKWAVDYCPNVELVLHVDDDVVPDIAGILRDFANIPRASRREIGCAKVFMPMVRREGKWKTSVEEYPGEQYPLSCVGWCFILPMEIVRDLYHVSLVTRVLHLEDVWVTGILREKIEETKLRKLAGGEKLCQHLGWPKDRPTNEKILEAWETLNRSKADTTVL